MQDTQQVVDIYARLSLDKRGTGENVDEQIRNSVTYIQSAGWMVGEVYRDDSVSATSGKTRDGWEALKTARTPGHPHIGRPVAVRHLDRLVRSARDLEDFLDLECNILSQNIGELRLDTATGRLMARQLVSYAAFEGEIRRERQQQAFQKIIQDGRHWWANRPFGYERDGTLREHEAALIKDAYAQVIQGVTVTAIARQWAEAIPPRRAKEWSGPLVRSVLVNPRNAAIRTHNGRETGPGKWEAIVDEGTFRAAHSILTRRQGRSDGGHKVTTELSKIAECATCGAGLKFNIRKGASYICHAGHVVAPAEWLESVVFQEMMATIPHLVTTPTNPQAELAIQVEMESVERRLLEAADLFAKGSITAQQLEALSAALRSDLTALQDQLATLISKRPVEALEGDLETLAERYSGLPLAQRRAIIQRTFDRIVVKGRGRGNRALKRDLVTFHPKAGN